MSYPISNIVTGSSPYVSPTRARLPASVAPAAVVVLKSFGFNGLDLDTIIDEGGGLKKFLFGLAPEAGMCMTCSIS